MNKKKIFNFCIEIISLIVFVILMIMVKVNKIAFFDDYVYKLVTIISNNYVTNFWKFISFFGSAYFLVGLTALLLIKKNKNSLLVTLNLIVIFLISQILKLIIARPRPINIALVKEGGYSFPSGHSTVSFAFFGFLFYLILNSNCSKKIKVIMSITLFSLIILIGISRIYLGVHFASDVLAGFSLALLYLLVYIKVIKKSLLK